MLTFKNIFFKIFLTLKKKHAPTKTAHLNIPTHDNQI